VPVGVGAQDVGQHASVSGVGLGAGLPVPISVARHRHRVDRVDREPGRLQGDDQQVLVRLDRDRHRQRVIRSAGELGLQRGQLAEAGYTRIDPAASQHPPLVVHDRDVVALLGPVDATGDRQAVLPGCTGQIEPEGTCGDLMEALNGAASHKPITDPATDGATVHIRDLEDRQSQAVSTRQRAHAHPARARAGEISVATRQPPARPSPAWAGTPIR
jgi:hypothetical protein